MQLLNTQQIINAVHKARKEFYQGNLQKDLKNSTVIDFWQRPEKSSVIKKKQLLKMAQNKEPRPIAGKYPLGRALCVYTNPNEEYYDAQFTHKIKKLAPYWFVSQSDIANQKKQELLKMAQNKEPRPIIRKHPLGAVLCQYTNHNKDCYDAQLTNKIKKLAPHWFVSQSDIANQKKQELLKMAQNKEPRPIAGKHPLGKALWHYTSQSNSTCDAQFTQKLKKLAPHWFITRSDVSNKKKQELLKMAQNKEPRPIIRKHPLGEALCVYTNPNQEYYDAQLTKKIKKLAPHWFITRSDIKKKKKQELLKMAQNKEPRPNNRKHPLGQALSRYTIQSSKIYDAQFTQKIKRLAPRWFKS